MAQITARPVWLPILFEDANPSVTLLGNAPLIAKGAEARFYISIFEKFDQNTASNPGTLIDISNFVAFILKVWATDYGTGTLLLDTSDAATIAAGAAVSFNPTATAAQFYSREAAQIQIYLPATVTANVTAGDRYAVFTGATSEAASQPDYFGRSLYNSLEVGLGTVAVPPSPTSEYVRSDVFQAAMNGVVRWGTNPPGRTFTVVSPSGAYGRTLGCSDESELITNLETF
jgi:hypothetical protein